MSHQIVTRHYARAHGLKRYFNGLPCSRGHLAERFAKSCKCVECSRERHRVQSALQQPRPPAISPWHKGRTRAERREYATMIDAAERAKVYGDRA